MTVEEIIDRTIAKEGKYSNDPNDLGGATMYGITERVARRNGYKGDMRNLSREAAKAIYMSEYYVTPGFAKIGLISPIVGEELFDTGVNMGPYYPKLWFQQWLNAFNNQGNLYPDIKEDGDIGPATRSAFLAFRKARGKEADKVMVAALNCSQGERYKELARARSANETFVWGWIRARVYGGE